LRHEPDTPGELEHGYIFQVLKDLGYDGWIGLEYHPERGTVEGLKRWMGKFNCSL